MAMRNGGRYRPEPGYCKSYRRDKFWYKDEGSLCYSIRD